MAFLEMSRYAGLQQVQAAGASGRVVTAVKLRRLPSPTAVSYVVQDKDRIDGLAQDRYRDGTRFWHIADANTELEAAQLTAEPARVINVPEQ